ncbi:MAG TPA: tetratricopeptide repeat protein [Candidatus Methylacidiphilales bacterium]|nr:tetratricopeptide repeat protein [Candidatus Methylacidiphilales bacterium]
MAAAPSLSSQPDRGWPWGLALILAVALTYTPVWQAGFIWDDDAFLTGNPCIIGPLGLREIWTTKAADICPLTLTMVWVGHAFWGLAPLPYHLMNVLLHAACAVLLWRVLQNLNVPGAWLGAMLWALHPLQVETVAWVSELRNTQSCLFYLLSILFFVKWLRTEENRPVGYWNYVLVLVFTVLAIASKSSTVVLPVVLCLCAWWLKGRWQWHSVTAVAPLFFMAIVAGGISILTRAPRAGEAAEWVRPWPERIAAAGNVIWFYVDKLICPYPLIASYPPWQIDAERWTSYLSLLAAIVIFFILWLKRRTWAEPWFFAFAYFLAALLPVLGLAQMNASAHGLVADHLQYLAGMGPLALAGAGLARLAGYVAPEKWWRELALGAGILVIFGTWSWQRAWVFENKTAFWADTLGKNPACWVGYNDLGNILARTGHLDEAIAYYQEALAYNSNYPDALNNLGGALAQQGRMDEAVANYQKALEIDPDLADAHNNLGLALFQERQVDQAIAQYQQALKIDPNLSSAHYNDGVALARKGEMNEAIEQFQEALKINPQDSAARVQLNRDLSGRK